MINRFLLSEKKNERGEGYFYLNPSPSSFAFARRGNRIETEREREKKKEEMDACRAFATAEMKCAHCLLIVNETDVSHITMNS